MRTELILFLNNTSVYAQLLLARPPFVHCVFSEKLPLSFYDSYEVRICTSVAVGCTSVAVGCYQRVLNATNPHHTAWTFSSWPQDWRPKCHIPSSQPCPEAECWEAAELLLYLLHPRNVSAGPSAAVASPHVPLLRGRHSVKQKSCS